MNVFDGNLEPIEASRLGGLNLGGKIHGKIFIDDTIGGSKKGQNVGDEMPLVGSHITPILVIMRQIQLFGRPK